MTIRRAVALIALGLAASAIAQTVGGERQAMERAQRSAREANARALRLEASARSALDAAVRARADAAAVAARIQAAEADIDTAEAQIAIIDRLRAAQRARLADKQGPTVRLVAALQTMARRPLALTLVQPGSIGDIVHTHAVLAGIIPTIRARTADLRADVERGRQLRRAADGALAAERTARQDLVAQRQRFAALEARRRAESQAFSSSAMIEQDRAIAMGEQARDIGELMGRIDDAASIRARLETLPGPRLRPALPGASQALPAETVQRAEARPSYRLPVVGTVVTGLGEVSETGVKARGLTIATRPAAQVVAPAAGRIAFAGPFRGYARIVVIDHGFGWTTLVTSLAAIDVRVGDTVDQGSPVGRAGPDRPTVTIELRRRGTPVDIARLAG